MSGGRLVITNIIGVVVILALLIWGGYYFTQKSNYISTDNAKVSGDLFTIVASSNGKITKFNVKDGQDVSKDEEVASLRTQNGSVSVAAPTDGRIIKTNVKEDEAVQAGESLASEIDMSKLFILANIDEDDVKDIKVGNDVDIVVDGDPNTTIDGKVDEIGSAANSIFSLTPSSNNNGNYTKVTQTIPVKISMSNYSEYVLPGMNAEIKISK
ncbi:HlyD family secretion protein [Priestia megaterium]|uniref:HlyD family secretion protein n=1 Tax=Priestia megaterium TaxID=1404 RepID=UPI00159BF915|nr:efflux RND transporter periplasmic adaptor subunit [Priestia megaterium]